MNRIKYLSKRVLPIDQFNEQNKSKEQSDSQKASNRYDRFTKRPSHRLSNSTKSRFQEQKSDHLEKFINTPESFFSQNLRIKQKLRERSQQKMKFTKSQQKFPKPTTPLMTPLHISHLKRLKQLQIQKNKSFFNTNCSSLQNSASIQNQNIEELFYKQVNFAQVCKSIERNAK